MDGLSRCANIYLTKFYRCVIIPIRRTAKNGRRFKSNPPEMEVSYMEVLALVMQLLHLITDIIRLTFDFSNKKK